MNRFIEYMTLSPRSDLDLIFYKSKELESTFIEIINPRKKNTVCGCIYRHPKMDINEFTTNYLNPLLTKLGKEGKNIFLLGDFNVDLLKIGTDTDIYQTILIPYHRIYLCPILYIPPE